MLEARGDVLYIPQKLPRTEAARLHGSVDREHVSRASRYTMSFYRTGVEKRRQQHGRYDTESCRIKLFHELR